MSGSPVYINGKLLGAIAIGFGFPKEPIGGVTPITQMIQGALPDNAPTPLKVASASTTRRSRRMIARLTDKNGLKPREFIEGSYIQTAASSRRTSNVTRVDVSLDLRMRRFRGSTDAATMAMRPCTRLVLHFRGVSPDSLPRWKNLFAPYGLTPMIGGGAREMTQSPGFWARPRRKTGVKANLGARRGDWRATRVGRY